MVQSPWVVGRESGDHRLTVTDRSDGETLHRVEMRTIWPMVAVNTDEWQGYSGLPGLGRFRSTVCHTGRERARDDSGDEVHEVHVNPLQGLRTGMRNFLRTFRGVSKTYLYQYVAMFEWGYNARRALPGFLWAILGVSSDTTRPTSATASTPVCG